MHEIVEQSLRRLRAGERVVWCVILSASGSTPRGPGAKMAVFADGTAAGTVGGGAGPGLCPLPVRRPGPGQGL